MAGSWLWRQARGRSTSRAAAWWMYADSGAAWACPAVLQQPEPLAVEEQGRAQLEAVRCGLAVPAAFGSSFSHALAG